MRPLRFHHVGHVVPDLSLSRAAYEARSFASALRNFIELVEMGAP